VEDDVDRLIAERPGRELMVPRYDDPARRVTDFLYRSGGTTAAYCLVAGDARVIINTGLGYEAPHHKRVFDAVLPGPTPYIVTTQAHVDHVGGVQLFREPETLYVAQANNLQCQQDDARIRRFRLRSAAIWFDLTGRDAARIAEENPGVSMHQDAPVPDLTFEDRLNLDVGMTHIELIAMAGETIDSAVVWLPEHRIAVISNLLGPLFPHFPNLNTLRGDRYRQVEPYLATVRALQALGPEMLVTGRHEPIVGAELIHAALQRLHDAVEWVHTKTLEGINAGTDLWTLMADVRLPAYLAVGEGYGKVSWAVRTIWETYVGWFKLASTTELYPDRHVAALGALTAMVGPDTALGLARQRLHAGDPLTALYLAEGVLAADADNDRAAALMVVVHRHLLEAGGDASFWEHGWLEAQVRRWGEQAGQAPP